MSEIIKVLNRASSALSNVMQRHPGYEFSELRTLLAGAVGSVATLEADNARMKAELEAVGAGGVQSLRCHDADACAMGQKPCPTPKACGCEVAPQAVQAAVPLGYIHPQNIDRLERGEPVAVRQHGWDGEPGQMAVYATHPTQHGLDGLTQAARDVIAERQRQISAEGWTPEHDDTHKEGEMCFAAAGYAAAASDNLQAIENRIDCALTMNDVVHGSVQYPWPNGWEFKPCTPRRALVKAGALIQAEIERIDRAASQAAKQGGASHG